MLTTISYFPDAGIRRHYYFPSFRAAVIDRHYERTARIY